jgi:hypothetical protein
MLPLKNKKSAPRRMSQVAHVPAQCRCGGEPTKPELVPNCSNRWRIQCKVEHCCARNEGQGLSDTILGWNRLSLHFYR